MNQPNQTDEKITFRTFEGTNWLITGGAGFIGTSLIERLLHTGHQVNIRILDNLSMGSREELQEVCRFREVSPEEIDGPPRGVELIVQDIRDFDACLRSAEGIDIVVHLAANTGVEPSVRDPRLDMEVNVVGTFNMLEAARRRGASRFVFASSGAPLGEVEPPIHEEKVPKPVSPYGASKLAGEGYCSAYYRTFGIRTVSLRFGNVYGPRSRYKSSVVAKFFRRALSGQTLEIYGDGTQTRDFIYIDDLIRAILLAAGTEVGGEVFQIATYRETTVNEIAHLIKEIVESSIGKRVTIKNVAPRPGDVRRNFSDISKAKRFLSFEPEYTLEEGLKRTFEYFVEIESVSRHRTKQIRWIRRTNEI